MDILSQTSEFPGCNYDLDVDVNTVYKSETINNNNSYIADFNSSKLIKLISFMNWLKVLSSVFVFFSSSLPPTASSSETPFTLLQVNEPSKGFLSCYFRGVIMHK